MQWIPTLTLFLFLYPAGWIISRFVCLFDSDISSNNLSIIGTIISFILFLSVLPSWGSIRWETNNIWLSIGLDVNNKFTAFDNLSDNELVTLARSIPETMLLTIDIAL